MDKNAHHPSNSDSHDISDIINQKIKSSLVRHVYQQSLVGQITSVFCGTFILIGLFSPSSDNKTLIEWYAFFIVIAMLRIIIAKLYSIQNNADQHLTLWRTLFIAGAFLGGVTWGLTGSVLFSTANPMQQIFIILVLAGITAGAAPLLATELLAAVAFLIAALLPLILQLNHLANNTYSLFAITAIAYFAYLIILSVKLRRLIKKSISLQFENTTLLVNLSKTKNQLEVINLKLAEAATHDPLTKLANRSLFETKFNEAINSAVINNKAMALFYIDLDNFKEINDAYGHTIGDKILLKIASRLKENVRESDTISRLGGDELTIIFENINDPMKITKIATQLCQMLAEPIILNDNTISVTASIGISMYPIDGCDAETLLKKADTAMYFAKSHGRNNFQLSAELIVNKTD